MALRRRLVAAEMQAATDVIRRDLIPPLLFMIRSIKGVSGNGDNRTGITQRLYLEVHNHFILHRGAISHADWRDAPSWAVASFQRVHTHLVTTCTRLTQALVTEPDFYVAELLLIPCLYTCGSWEAPRGIPRHPMVYDASRVRAVAAAMHWVLERFRLSQWDCRIPDAADLLRVLMVGGELALITLVELQARDGTARLTSKLRELHSHDFLEMTFCIMGKLLYLMRVCPMITSCFPPTFTCYDRFYASLCHCLVIHLAFGELDAASTAPGMLCPSLSHLCKQLISLDVLDYPSSALQVDVLATLLWACRQLSYPSPPFLHPSQTQLRPSMSDLELLRHLPKCARRGSMYPQCPNPCTRSLHLTWLVWDVTRRLPAEVWQSASSTLMLLVCLFGNQQQETTEQFFDSDVMVQLMYMAISACEGCHVTCVTCVPSAGHLVAMETLVRSMGPGFKRVDISVELVLRVLLLSPCTSESLPACVSIATTALKLVSGLTWQNTEHIRTLCLDLMFSLHGRRQDTARSGVRLLAVVAAILARVSVGASPQAQDEVVRMVCLLGPMGGVQAAVIASMTWSMRVPGFDSTGYIWLTAFPRILPGCSSWTCVNMHGKTELCVRTRLCGGCRKVRYCGEACQKAAWRDGHCADCVE